jgi:hypothetical protein
VAEPKDCLAQPRLRDWPMFQKSPGTRKHQRPVFDGRPLPKISELLMSHLQGTPAEKLAWLQEVKAEGKLDADDPAEVAEAEALLRMLARFSGSRAHEEKRHLDELLDEGLRGTFPASDPVSVGRFTGAKSG